ncbi:MAG: hypothetical protein ACLFST_07060 [Spirochaetia bacterium]
MKLFLLLCFLSIFLIFPVTAQETGERDLTIPEELQPPERNVPVNVGGELDHYDSDGFPEDEDGLLVFDMEETTPLVTMEDDPVPFPLLAQFANIQRDAVFLSRNAPIIDTRPDGTRKTIPFGYGAVKLNTVYLSLVEGIVLPHFSDNRKEYRVFPLSDIYIGASAGFTGIGGDIRFTLMERYCMYSSFRINAFRSLRKPPFSYNSVSVVLGGGYRFISPVTVLLGQNFWTVGLEMYSGFGDGDRDPATRPFYWIPGIFFEIEKTFSPKQSGEQDYRTDPRPHNYRVSSFSLRGGLGFNIGNYGDSGFLKLDLSLTYRFNIKGPSIPVHEFKQTEPVYLSEQYLAQIEAARKRREIRAEEGESGGL